MGRLFFVNIFLIFFASSSLENVSVRSLAILGLILVILGLILAVFGPHLGHLGPHLGQLEPHLGHLGPHLGHLGPHLGHLGPQTFLRQKVRTFLGRKLGLILAFLHLIL